MTTTEAAIYDFDAVFISSSLLFLAYAVVLGEDAIVAQAADERLGDIWSRREPKKKIKSVN